MSKKNTLYIFSILLLIGIALAAQNVKAHSPITIDLSYDSSAEMLSVKITHGVSDNEYHFVESIVIEVNESEVLTETYSFQTTHNINAYLFSVVANQGAKIDVTAYCSLGGSLTEHMVVGEVHIEHKGSFMLALVPTIVSTILVIALLYLLPLLGQKKVEIRSFLFLKNINRV